MRYVSTETPTSEPPLVDVTPPVPPASRRRGSPLSLLGIVVSIVSLAAVVWWAAHQEAPTLPHTAGEIAALLGAIALYGLATVVRAERWQRLLVDEGATPHRADTYGLTVVGYAGNNILPARAGDAIRVVLMAPRAQTSNRTVIGTLVAERLLDVAVLLVIFVVVGYGLLGEVGGDSVELIAAGRRGGVHRRRRRLALRAPQRAPARADRADRLGHARAAHAPTTGSCCSA